MSVYRLKELVNVWMEDGKGREKKKEKRSGQQNWEQNWEFEVLSYKSSICSLNIMLSTSN